ncbi:hypothetical protein [Aquipuribacter hungaricus]|uniref:Uncharacterized protein n=1 Tax=Aquipuribacter hungaricus TaxID=545624 RepID=A0ABV7WCR5_9MICO
MSPGTPSDWVSGERVFAPPPGTVDVDWLVPAVLELAPGTTPAQARAALEAAWRRRRAGAAPGPLSPGSASGADLGAAVPAAPTALAARNPRGVGGEVDADLKVAAERVLAEALATFGD